MRGRKPLPLQEHIRRGTYRRDRHGPLPVGLMTRVECADCGVSCEITVEQLRSNRGATFLCYDCADKRRGGES